MFALSFEAKAALNIYCSHHELCQIVKIITAENHLGTQVSTQNLVNIIGDAHEYEPSTNEIKQLINAPLLITGPNELNPWIKKVNFQRSKNSALKTISLLFEANDYKLYPDASAEILSHFWLYPKVYCVIKSRLEERLSEIPLYLKNKKSCESNKIEEELKESLKKIDIPIILTHDALQPLLLELASHNQNIVAMKGSGHHEEANPASIKKMYDALRAPKVIWIIESGINIPQNISNKIRSNDIILKINTGESLDTDKTANFSILYQLAQKLRELKR